MTIFPMLNNASASLMLVALVTGQPVFADTHVSPPVVEVVEPVVDSVPPTVQEVLLSVCEQNGYGEDCAKTLLGMLWNESSNISTAVGDQGRARGYFQIWYKLHNITIACAEDLVCSANWTIGYLEQNSYPKYASYAIQCHNSCNAGNGYAARAFRNGERLWNQPLMVVQTAPVELVMK